MESGRPEDDERVGAGVSGRRPKRLLRVAEFNSFPRVFRGPILAGVVMIHLGSPHVRHMRALIEAKRLEALARKQP